MGIDYFEQPVKFPSKLFVRLDAFQQSKHLSIEGIIIPLLERLIPQTGNITETSFPDGFFAKTSELTGNFVSRLVKVPSSLLAGFIAYQKTRQVTIEDIIIPVLDKGLPKLSVDADQKLAAPLFPAEFRGIEKSSTEVLFKDQLSCPFDKMVFFSPGLKYGGLQSQPDDFYLTKYTETIGNRTYIDYSLFSIKICPACLYANREKGFRTYDRDNESWRDPRGLDVKEKYVAAMQETIDRRFRIAAQAGLEGHRLFSTQRTFEDALIAASLGIDFVTTLLTMAQANEKARYYYFKGILHIMQSQYYHKIEHLGKDVNQHKEMRLACLREAMDAFSQVESGMMQDRYFEGLRECLLYYYQKMVVAEFIGDKNAFDASKQVIRKLYSDYCLGIGKGTPEERKTATIFFKAIDEGDRQYDTKLTLR